MKPFSRVVALDNNQEDLDIIVRALGRAGYSSIPYLFDLATFTPPVEPCAGLRLIFSDIHLTPTSSINGVDHASTIGNFIKAIVPHGPYGIIFWSKHDSDEAKIVGELKSRADDIGFNLPVFFGFMDKNVVGIGSDDDDIDYDLLRKKIHEQISKSSTLSVVMDWEERVLMSAVRTSNSLFDVLNNPESEDISSDWMGLLAYLSQEAVGSTSALSNATAALDNALLPIVEDQLRTQIDTQIQENHPISDLIKSAHPGKLKLASSVNRASLNSFYLVEDFNQSNQLPYNARGVISAVDKGENVFFQTQFGSDWADILYSEFIINGETTARDPKLVERATPCLISLSAECDEVQGKIPSHRYLLGVTFDSGDVKNFRNSKGLARGALQSIGLVRINGLEKCVIVSCRRFTSEHSALRFPLTAVARLRQRTLEEVIHHYTNHIRRPGVMRFF